MLASLVRLLARQYFGGSRRGLLMASLVTIGFTRLRSVLGRREVVDMSNIKPGETIVIEHLPISHKEQIKQFKRDERRAKKAAKGDGKQQAVSTAGMDERGRTRRRRLGRLLGARTGTTAQP